MPSRGRLFATLFNGGQVRIWNLDTRKVHFQLNHTGHKKVSLAVAPAGEALLTAGRVDDIVRVWGATARPAELLESAGTPIYPLAVSPDDALAATGSWDGQVRIWDLASGTQLSSLQHDNSVEAVAFSPDGRTLACGSARVGLSLWDLRSAVRLAHRRDLLAAAVAWAPDGSHLAIGANLSIRILHARSLQERLVITTEDRDLTALAWSVDGRLLASGTRRGVLSLWDADSGERLAKLQGPRGGSENWEGVRSIAFAPDGARLATAWGDSQIFVHELADIAVRRELVGHQQEVFGVAWSPDGRRLASGGRDNSLRLWNPDTGGLLLDVVGHEDYIFSVAFSHDGRRIVTGSGDGTVGLWHSEPAVARWAARARARHERLRLEPLVAGLFEEVGAATAVAERIAALPELTERERRLAWNLVLERAAPVVASAGSLR